MKSNNAFAVCELILAKGLICLVSTSLQARILVFLRRKKIPLPPKTYGWNLKESRLLKEKKHRPEKKGFGFQPGKFSGLYYRVHRSHVRYLDVFSLFLVALDELIAFPEKRMFPKLIYHPKKQSTNLIPEKLL